MKQREGFVSNSSSMSYIVWNHIGREAVLREVTAKDIADICVNDPKGLNEAVLVVKDKNYEGDDFIQFDSAIILLIRRFRTEWIENNSQYRMVLIRDGGICRTDTFYDETWWDNPDQRSFDISYGATEDVEEFVPRYLMKYEDAEGYLDSSIKRALDEKPMILFHTGRAINPLEITDKDSFKSLRDGEDSVLSIVDHSAVADFLDRMYDREDGSYMDVYTLDTRAKEYLYDHWDEFLEHCRDDETRLYINLEIEDSETLADDGYNHRYLTPYYGTVFYPSVESFYDYFFNKEEDR